MTPTLYYCYDAYCGWCYGFSPVIKKIEAKYQHLLAFEVLSGGMIIAEKPLPISVSAAYIQSAYKVVEEHTGIRFGADYLWHIQHPNLSDWFPNSEKPAIALCIFKEMYEDKQVAFAADLQYSLHFEGRDLCDDAAYQHLLEKYDIAPETFYQKLHNQAYKQKAYTEFEICKQLQVTGYPQVLLQTSPSKFHLLAKGYTPFNTLEESITAVLQTLAP